MLCVEIYNDAMAELQDWSGNRFLPMPVLPAWSIDESRPRSDSAAPRSGFRGVNMTSDPQDAGSPDLASRDWDPLWEVCADLAPAGALPHRRQPHRDELLRQLLLAVAGRVREARDRRLDAVHQQRARRDQHDLRRHLRPPPEAADGVGRERHRLDPVHPRDDGLRAARERAGAGRRARAQAVGVLQATTGTRRSGSSRTGATCRASSTSSARTTSCSRPTSRTRRASTRRRSTRWRRR